LRFDRNYLTQAQSNQRSAMSLYHNSSIAVEMVDYHSVYIEDS